MDTKRLEIEGKTNRYWIKKLVTDQTHVKKMLVKPDISFLADDQIAYIDKYEDEIKTKIRGYIQQDKLKNLYCAETFIDEAFVKSLLKDNGLKCIFCKLDVLFLYDIQREMKQWTLDRIRNDEGHNKNNVVVSCLKCNLKRRKTNFDSFMFSSNLEVVKKEEDKKEDS
jgi:5-methylcytosine-specific restriction endonuclease McrA